MPTAAIQAIMTSSAMNSSLFGQFIATASPNVAISAKPAMSAISMTSCNVDFAEIESSNLLANLLSLSTDFHRMRTNARWMTANIAAASSRIPNRLNPLPPLGPFKTKVAVLAGEPDRLS